MTRPLDPVKDWGSPRTVLDDLVINVLPLPDRPAHRLVTMLTELSLLPPYRVFI